MRHWSFAMASFAALHIILEVLRLSPYGLSMPPRRSVLESPSISSTSRASWFAVAFRVQSTAMLPRGSNARRIAVTSMISGAKPREEERLSMKAASKLGRSSSTAEYWSCGKTDAAHTYGGVLPAQIPVGVGSGVAGAGVGAGVGARTTSMPRVSDGPAQGRGIVCQSEYIVGHLPWHHFAALYIILEVLRLSPYGLSMPPRRSAPESPSTASTPRASWFAVAFRVQSTAMLPRGSNTRRIAVTSMASGVKPREEERLPTKSAWKLGRSSSTAEYWSCGKTDAAHTYGGVLPAQIPVGVGSGVAGAGVGAGVGARTTSMPRVSDGPAQGRGIVCQSGCAIGHLPWHHFAALYIILEVLRLSPYGLSMPPRRSAPESPSTASTSRASWFAVAFRVQSTAMLPRGSARRRAVTSMASGAKPREEERLPMKAAWKLGRSSSTAEYWSCGKTDAAHTYGGVLPAQIPVGVGSGVAGAGVGAGVGARTTSMPRVSDGPAQGRGIVCQSGCVVGHHLPWHHFAAVYIILEVLRLSPHGLSMPPRRSAPESPSTASTSRASWFAVAFRVQSTAMLPRGSYARRRAVTSMASGAKPREEERLPMKSAWKLGRSSSTARYWISGKTDAAHTYGGVLPAQIPVGVGSGVAGTGVGVGVPAGVGAIVEGAGVVGAGVVGPGVGAVVDGAGVVGAGVVGPGVGAVVDGAGVVGAGVVGPGVGAVVDGAGVVRAGVVGAGVVGAGVDGAGVVGAGVVGAGVVRAGVVGAGVVRAGVVGTGVVGAVVDGAGVVGAGVGAVVDGAGVVGAGVVGAGVGAAVDGAGVVGAGVVGAGVGAVVDGAGVVRAGVVGVGVVGAGVDGAGVVGAGVVGAGVGAEVDGAGVVGAGVGAEVDGAGVVGAGVGAGVDGAGVVGAGVVGAGVGAGVDGAGVVGAGVVGAGVDDGVSTAGGGVATSRKPAVISFISVGPEARPRNVPNSGSRP